VKNVERIGVRRREQYLSARFEDMIQRIGANVLALREQKGWSQENAAKRCSMGLRMYQRVEAAEGNLMTTTMARLCDGFDVDVVRLVRPIRK
jgi:transcriptional regulator with XRE-family HTH domain